MVILADTLPRQFVDLCWRVKREITPGKPNWATFENALDKAETENGYDRTAVMALFIGLEASTAWLVAQERKAAVKNAQDAKELARHRRRQPFHKDVYELAEGVASSMSETGLKQTQSLIIYGFMLHHDANLFEDLDWTPLLDALAFVLNVEEEPEEVQIGRTRETATYDFSDITRKMVSERIRLRIYRLRKLEEHDMDWVQTHSAQYFRELYAISEKDRRVRTINERGNRR